MEPTISYRIESPLAEAEAAVRAALQAEGFGILTEVDVTATLRAKLGIETKPYRILGACNAAIAHRAMSADPHVGAFLPCGLAIYEEPAGVTTVVPPPMAWPKPPPRPGTGSFAHSRRLAPPNGSHPYRPHGDHRPCHTPPGYDTVALSPPGPGAQR